LLEKINLQFKKIPVEKKTETTDSGKGSSDMFLEDFGSGILHSNEGVIYEQIGQQPMAKNKN